VRLLRWFFDWPAPLFLIVSGCLLVASLVHDQAWSVLQLSRLPLRELLFECVVGVLPFLLIVSVPIAVGVLRIRLTLRRNGWLEHEIAAPDPEDTAKTPHFTCPCCGYRTLAEPPGSYEVCKVCFWEDDGVQLLDPACAGADDPSLLECQATYQRIGACEERFRRLVRAPRRDEVRDPEWRPAREADLRRVRRPSQRSEPAPSRVENWYYWQRTDPA
jgi:Cysteine-rich CPCC